MFYFSHGLIWATIAVRRVARLRSIMASLVRIDLLRQHLGLKLSVEAIACVSQLNELLLAGQQLDENSLFALHFLDFKAFDDVVLNQLLQNEAR